MHPLIRPLPDNVRINGVPLYINIGEGGGGGKLTISSPDTGGHHAHATVDILTFFTRTDTSG